MVGVTPPAADGRDVGGQGLSEAAGPYILDEIAAARRRGGAAAADETMTRLLATDHLSDQVAAYEWLRAQPFVRPGAIATMGNSFGGIETVLGAAQLDYCAVVDATGGAQTWDDSPVLRERLARAAAAAPMPVLFFQAENDYSIAPSQTLFAIREKHALPSEIRIYPAFGSSQRDGHSLPYRGVPVWRDDVLAFLERHCVR